MFLPAYSTNQQDSIHGIDKDACSNSVGNFGQVCMTKEAQ